MKTKRFLSVLLALALCLGMLPGTTLAETGTGDGTEIKTTISIDGENYVRLYRAITNEDSSISYFETAECNADGDTGLKLCYYTGTEYVFINNTDYNCTYDYGTLVWDSNSERLQFIWQPNLTGIGQTSYIYATKGDTKYAFPVTVTAPEFGVYTQSPDTTDLTKGYVSKANESYTVPYDMTNGTTVYIYWAAGISACSNQTPGVSVEVNGQSNSVSNLTDTNNISIKLPASNEANTSVTLSVTNKHANRTSEVNINFQSPTAPDGKPWMYDGNGNTSISQPAGGGSDIQLKFKNEDGTYTYITGTENGDNKTISCDAAFGQFVWVSSHSAWNWQTDNAIPGTSGYIYATIGNETYSIAVTVNPPDYGLYSTVPSNGYSSYIPRVNGVATVNFTSNESKTVYLYTGNNNITFNTTGYGSDNNAVTVRRIDDRTLEITLAPNNTGTINTEIKCPATKNNSARDWSYRILFTDGTGTGSGGNQGGPSSDTLIEAVHRLEADEIYASDRISEHMGEFTLPGDNNIYYMVPSTIASSDRVDYPHLNGDSSSYSAQTQLMFIEFWVDLGQNNYARVKDTATLAKIQEQFGGTLKMELLAAEYYQSPLPTDYPATYTTTEVDAWRQPIKAKFDFGSAGTWIYCASGTINGELVTAEVRSTFRFSGDVIWNPDTNSNVDVITQVNNYLETVELPDNFGLIVNLPAGVYYGYITVPSRLSQDGISINGAYDEKTGIWGTTLYGGVQGENRRTHVNGIHFIGGGSGNGDKTWKGFSDKRSVNNGKDNYAYFGSCGGNFENCIFENYYCAVLTSHEIKTGTNSQFINNQTAVCYDSMYWAGIGSPLASNVYQNNEIAIHFAQFTNHYGPTILSIVKSCFVDNKTDIRNDIKRNIFIPGNYFACTENGIEKTRECQYLPQANGNKDKLVHYYPQSANRQFNAWIYDMSRYKHDPVVSANLAATYKIPAEYLTKSVTVMNEDEALAVWTFGKKEEE